MERKFKVIKDFILYSGDYELEQTDNYNFHLLYKEGEIISVDEYNDALKMITTECDEQLLGNDTYKKITEYFQEISPKQNILEQTKEYILNYLASEFDEEIIIYETYDKIYAKIKELEKQDE